MQRFSIPVKDSGHAFSYVCSIGENGFRHSHLKSVSRFSYESFDVILVFANQSPYRSTHFPVEVIDATGSKDQRIPRLRRNEIVRHAIHKQGIAEENVESQSEIAFSNRLIAQLQAVTRKAMILGNDHGQIAQIFDAGKLTSQQLIQIEFGRYS